RRLGADELAEQERAHHLGLVRRGEHVELPVGALQVAGEAEQLRQEGAPGGVGGVLADVVERGGDGILEAAVAVQFVRVHGASSSGNPGFGWFILPPATPTRSSGGCRR